MDNKLYTVLSDIALPEIQASNGGIKRITVRNLDEAINRCFGSGYTLLQDPVSVQGHLFALFQDPGGQIVMISAVQPVPCIEVIGAKTNNLKSIDVLIPLN